MRARAPIAGALAAALALGVGACGEDGDAERPDRQGEELRRQGEDLQERARSVEEDVRRGRTNPEDAARDLERDAEQLGEEARDTAMQQLEDLKKDIPPEQREQIEELQRQLEGAAP